MPRTRSIAWSELKLGVIGIVAMVMVSMLVIAVGGQGGFFWQRYPLKTRFEQINGLKTGAVVRLNGKDVGKVTAEDFSGGQIEVSMEISKSVRSLVTTESRASVGSLGLLGEAVIDLKAATAGAPLADWGYVPAGPEGGLLGSLTQTASKSLTSADELITSVKEGRGTLGKLVTDDALYAELETFVTSATNVTRAMEQGEGTLGGLMKDPAALNQLKASLESLKAVTAKINDGQGPLGRMLNDEKFGASLANVSSNLDAVTSRMNRGDGTLGKLMTDRQLYDRFNGLSNRMDQVIANLQAGQGTAGQLLHDQRLYETMNQAASELKSLLSDIRKDPKKYLRVSVSIF
jgi:phospholipid/cholesterol/gamma-HCH transport system substrate-binding protein